MDEELMFTEALFLLQGEKIIKWGLLNVRKQVLKVFYDAELFSHCAAAPSLWKPSVRDTHFTSKGAPRLSKIDFQISDVSVASHTISGAVNSFPLYVSVSTLSYLKLDNS